MRFKPDEQIFGKGAKFKPARLFKMARSKAYLFGGVEIRWSVDPVHLADKDDTPQKAVRAALLSLGRPLALEMAVGVGGAAGRG